MSPPWGLPLPKVWNLLVTISDQKYVCEGFFPWTVFINEEHDVVSPVSHCPCQTGWLRSCFCPISTKPLDQRLIFFLKQPGPWQIHGTVLGEIVELCFQLLSISKSWRQKVKTLEWPVGPHYNWFDTSTWPSSNRQEKLAHLQNDCSTCWVSSNLNWIEVRVVRLQFPDEVPPGGQCWSALFLVPTKLVLIDW